MKIESCFRNRHHPLILREKKIDEQVIISCRICTRLISEASFFICDSCEYYLHKSCTDLPDQINHFFHPSHPLKLVKERSTSCDSCGNYFYKDALIYNCSECDFDMDLECALMPTKASYGEGLQCIQHSSHPHSLLLVEADIDDQIECDACKLTRSSGLVYGCTKCRYFLHKSCAEFARQIQHPLHLCHGLLSLSPKRYGYNCSSSSCQTNKASGFNLHFRCHRCPFGLCWECGTNVRRTIMYEHHDHNLCFVEEADIELHQCNGYEGYCQQPSVANCSEFNRTIASALACFDCNFKVHLLCGPLPSTIKHEYHIHRLTLVDSLIEDNSGEYYCDICEIERDPRIRLYYCEECKYFAHVHCVISEIAKVLTGDGVRGDVELKTLGGDIWKLRDNNGGVLEEHQSKSALTFLDLLNQLTKVEQRGLRHYYKWNDASSKSNTNITTQSELKRAEDADEILTLFSSTDTNFVNFFYSQLKRFFRDNQQPFKSSDLALKTVNVEGYMIPSTVVPVMRALLHKHGDVSSDDAEFNSREWKSVIYFVLCEVLRRMGSTLVTDITTELLQEWYFHLSFAKYYQFKVDFARARLKRLVRAFLGLQANKLQDKVPAMIHGKITKLEQEIFEEKSKLDICKKYRDSFAKSELMSDCLKEASDMEWKKAYDQDSFF